MLCCVGVGVGGGGGRQQAAKSKTASDDDDGISLGADIKSKTEPSHKNSWRVHFQSSRNLLQTATRYTSMMRYRQIGFLLPTSVPETTSIVHRHSAVIISRHLALFSDKATICCNTPITYTTYPLYNTHKTKFLTSSTNNRVIDLSRYLDFKKK